jgi:CO dehydrogenase maturation factor
VDGAGEYVVVDMTAGADSFASGLFTRFDLTLLVCEPTLRSVGVYRQYLGYARDLGVRVAVVGNKVDAGEDEAFLREHVGEDLLTCLGRSGYIRGAERGVVRPIEELEPASTVALDAIRSAVDGCVKDWPRYTRQAVQFHLRNAAAWGNGSTGEDLVGQVDPDFVLGPEALAAAHEEGKTYVSAGS